VAVVSQIIVIGQRGWLPPLPRCPKCGNGVRSDGRRHVVCARGHRITYAEREDVLLEDYERRLDDEYQRSKHSTPDPDGG
jgi:tRNA(Ile2) C34 agmatinyltransferase TiaS